MEVRCKAWIKKLTCFHCLYVHKSSQEGNVFSLKVVDTIVRCLYQAMNLSQDICEREEEGEEEEMKTKLEVNRLQSATGRGQRSHPDSILSTNSRGSRIICPSDGFTVCLIKRLYPPRKALSFRYRRHSMSNSRLQVSNSSVR